MAARKVVDYVVLGAGSAGSVLANRLTKAGRSVTVLEAGRKDIGRIDSWTIQMPSALTYSVADKRYNWDYHTVPQEGLNNREIHQPRGKVLGGSSSINAMVYVRGHALDFERWANEEGAKGWSYAECLPYFKRAQGYIEQPGQEKTDSEYRGYDGPLKVTSYEKPGTRTNVLFDVLQEAGGEAGYPITDDLNGYKQEGFSPFDMTVDAKCGTRCSTAAAYLRPAMENPQTKGLLDVKTRTLVHRIIFDKSGDTPKAIGVECENLDSGEKYEIHAEKEVILSMGAVGSPQVLMLSGIGDESHLKQVGVADVVLHNPDVGANLQDHLEVYLQYLCNLPVSLYPVAKWTLRYLHKRVLVGLEWFLRGTGICASNQFETGAFIRSDKGIEHPDIQFHFIPGCVLGQLDFLPHHGFQVHVGTLRPTSRGTIKLASANPSEAPIIDPKFLDTERDVQDMVKAVRLADEVIQQPAFAKYKGERLSPSPEIDMSKTDEETDKQIADWIKDSSHSAYHLSCTCAIGKVVDENGLVKGVEGLRVCDASIMPSMTSGNLNSPTIMIAEKISDNILGKTLPKEDLPYYVAEGWQEKQR